MKDVEFNKKQNVRKSGVASFINSFLYSDKIAPYVFALPFILSFLIFFIYPAFSTLIMSFQKVLPNQTEFIGLKNYATLFSSHLFYIAVRNSFIYMVLTLIILIPLPMILATLLNSKCGVFRNFFRATVFIPALVSVVVAGMIFRLIFGDTPTALANSIVTKLGGKPLRWLTDGNQFIAYFLLVLLATWRWLGVNMMYYLSGLNTIPSELYESAAIDGASALKQFRYITVPMLRPVTIYILTISIYGGLAMFTESLILWNGNKSPMNVGLTIVGLLYRMGFEQNNMGMASAIGLILLCLTMGLNLLQLRSFGLFKENT